MNFFENDKMQLKENMYGNTINYFFKYRLEENSTHNNEFYEIVIKNQFEYKLISDDTSENTDDIKEKDIYFIKNINSTENNIIDFNNINQKTNISSEKKPPENFLKKKRRQGRKKKDSLEEGQHNKKSFDNLLRKIKNSLLNSVRNLSNNKTKVVYKFKKLPPEWKLIKIDPKHARNSNIEFNKIFIHKSLKEIFSEDTTIKNFCNRDHNKILIEQLLNEKDGEKRKNFEILFNLTFLDLMKYSVGERQDLIQLQGLSLSKKLLNEMAIDEEYSKLIIDVLKNIENILENKLPRRRIKKIYLKRN